MFFRYRAGSRILKTGTWEEIAREFNATAETPRSVKQLNKAYSNFQTRTKQQMAPENVCTNLLFSLVFYKIITFLPDCQCIGIFFSLLTGSTVFLSSVILGCVLKSVILKCGLHLTEFMNISKGWWCCFWGRHTHNP